jgi:hypothetical protein
MYDMEARVKDCVSTGVLIATGCVNHELLNELKEFIIGSGKLKRHKAVNIL